MRQPYVFPLSESPFSTDIPPLERRQRVLAVGADVVTDELGQVVDFMSEDDVEAVLCDPRFAAVALPTLHLSGVTEGPLYELWSLLMFGKDGDEHRRIRNAVAREFTPRAVDARRPVIEEIAGTLCDPLADAREVDLSPAYAVPFATRVACQLVGVPEADAPRAGEWAFALVRAFFPFMSAERRSRAERAAVEFTAYVDDLIAAKRVEPTDDLASRLVSGDGGEQLTYEETRALIANMVFAGLEATAKSITTGVFHLLDQDRYGELVRSPQQIPAAVLELLRFTPPAQSVARGVPADMVCQDVALTAGQVVSANLLAACRDPQRHHDPDSLDFTRHQGKGLVFGAGAHYCLGAQLAKLAAAVALEALVSRFPDLRLAEGDVLWDYEGFTGVVALPVRLHG
jgi:cytochrome P450